MAAGVILRNRSYVPAPVFPLQLSVDGHAFIDQRSTAFPILLRNAWSITEITAAAYTPFLLDTVAKGFSGVEAWIPGRFPGTINAARDGSNNLAFTKRLDGAAWDGTLTYANINTEAPDFTFPNESYWLSIDAFFSACQALGLLVLPFFAYVGYPTTPVEGWMNEMVANGTTKMETYGATLAARYANQANLLWMIGGDRGTGSETFTSPELAVETAFAAGLTSVARSSPWVSAEWRHPSNAMSFLSTYTNVPLTYVTSTEIIAEGATAWAIAPTRPTGVLECPFNRHPSASGVTRRYAWRGCLSTRNGYALGDWEYYLFPSGWESHLSDDVGNLDCARVNRFWRSIPWYDLIPGASAITAGGGTANTEDQVACMRTASGSLLVAYIPPTHTGSVTIDMTVMAGTTTARWFDPTNEAYSAIGSFANTGTHAYTPTGNNNAGDTDWVLVLDA